MGPVEESAGCFKGVTVQPSWPAHIPRRTPAPTVQPWGPEAVHLVKDQVQVEYSQ